MGDDSDDEGGGDLEGAGSELTADSTTDGDLDSEGVASPAPSSSSRGYPMEENNNAPSLSLSLSSGLPIPGLGSPLGSPLAGVSHGVTSTTHDYHPFSSANPFPTPGVSRPLLVDNISSGSSSIPHLQASPRPEKNSSTSSGGGDIRNLTPVKTKPHPLLVS